MSKVSNVSKGEQVVLFNSVAIETSSLCNRHCHFCPNDYSKRPDQLMEEKLYTKLLAELSNLKYRGRIEFYIYNEPTRDKRLLQWIKMARLSVPHACLMFSTNGDYMKGSEDIIKWFDAGLNQMLINIYSANDGSDNEKAFKNGVEQAKKRMAMIKGWMKETGISGGSLYNYIGSKKRVLEISPKFGVRKNTSVRDTDFESISNRAGNIENFRGAVKEPLAKHCTKPFRFLNINWKGIAMLCCNDYYGKTQMGDANKQSLVEIWNGEKFNKYRLKLQNKNRNQFLCSGCDSNGGYYPHMVNKVTFGKQQDKDIMNNFNG